ncbi:MAG: AMP-binding protein [Acidimicrobiales bacterium]|nr:AMP-binding protein [Acidimicrobiales bacterium]
MGNEPTDGQSSEREPDGLPQTLSELVDHARRLHGDVEAMVDGDVRMTFAELTDAIDELGAALVASGIEPGDAVALWAPNIWEWTVAAFATFRAGGILVPINTRFRGQEAAFVLQKSRAKLLLTVNGFLGTDYPALLAEAAAELPDLRETVILRGDVAPGTIGRAELLTRVDDAARATAAGRHGVRGPLDCALVMFTSGTTGLPKGVMVASQPIIRGFSFYGQCMGMQRGERMLIISPFFHAFGFNGSTVPCFVYGTTILPHAVFDATDVLGIIQRERINTMPGAPAIFQSLLNHPDLADYDLSSLKRCVTGAATIPVEMVVQMRERLGMERVITAFGMTETSGIVTICRPEDDPQTIASTSGRAIPGMEVRIVDDEGAEVPRGQSGEIVVRGYTTMLGYLDDPEQTAATIDPDGWLHTGDIGVMDERGYIDITDRKKDMFIVGGFNAYPAEIERMMIEHPGIGQVSVIGIADDRLGEVGAAFVVPAAGATPHEAEIIAWCREKMANYKVPRKVWVVDALPLNASNKVLKIELRERAKQLLT